MPVTPIALRYNTVNADGNISVLTTSTQIVASRGNRIKLLVLNRHATMTLYLSGDSVVSASTHNWRLTGGQSLDLGAFSGALYGSGSSTALTAVYLEGYDS